MLRGLNMPFDLQDEEQKKFFREAVRAGIDAWLNSKFEMVGKWTLRGLVAAALGALVHFIVSNNGWGK